MKDIVYLPITSCDKCPNRGVERYYTEDPFEDIYQWNCKAVAFKRITLHEWNDPVPAIPEWCPLRANGQ